MKTPKNPFDPDQIRIGMEIEKEHTDDPKEAIKIALDHLIEIPDYYTKLTKMEAQSKPESTIKQYLKDKRYTL